MGHRKKDWFSESTTPPKKASRKPILVIIKRGKTSCTVLFVCLVRACAIRKDKEKKKTVAMEQNTLDTEGGAELGAVAQLALGDTKALVRLDADFDGAAELVGLGREVRGAALDEVDEAKGNSLSLLD